MDFTRAAVYGTTSIAWQLLLWSRVHGHIGGAWAMFTVTMLHAIRVNTLCVW